MESNYIGLVLSYSLFTIVFFMAIIFHNFRIKTEISRKIIHITISNWWIIVMVTFDSVYFALIPPITFLLFNYISYRFHLVKAIEREDQEDLGTIYYPLSLILLVIFSFTYAQPYIGAIGVFIMGYGDGLAGLVGKYIGRRRWFFNKTIEGSLIMFITSIITVATILIFYNPHNILISSITIAIIATLLELFSLKGIDNLTVPIISSLTYFIFFF